MKRATDAGLARLDDYVRGHDAEAEASAFEEELFARALADEAPDLELHEALGQALRASAASGALELWLTKAGVARLEGSGLRVLRARWSESGPASVPDLDVDFDVLVTEVPIDLRGARRLDVEIFDLEGRHLKTMPEVSFDPDDGAVYACCDAKLARLATRARTMSRVWVTDAEGRRSVVLELPT